MGALTRATRSELAESAADPEFWIDWFARIAGGETLKALCDERVWAYGEAYRTIRADERLSQAYDDAKRGQAEYEVDAALAVVRGASEDGVAVAKLQSDFGLKVAGKWDRQRYGEKVDVAVTAVKVEIVRFAVEAPRDVTVLENGSPLRVEAPKVTEAVE